MHDQCGVHAGGEWGAHGNVERCRQCGWKSAGGGVEWDGRDFNRDYCSGTGRIFDCDDGFWWDGVLRIGDKRSAGGYWDGAAGMRAVVGADHLQSDTGVGGFERRVN